MLILCINFCSIGLQVLQKSWSSLQTFELSSNDCDEISGNWWRDELPRVNIESDGFTAVIAVSFLYAQRYHLSLELVKLAQSWPTVIWMQKSWKLDVFRKMTSINWRPPGWRVYQKAPSFEEAVLVVWVRLAQNTSTSTAGTIWRLSG